MSKRGAEPILTFKSHLMKIPVGKMAPNPANPREAPSKTEVSDIRQSIESVGEILVPLVVYENPRKHKRTDPKYIILDGERRWRAAVELSKTNDKFKKVPANVISGPLSKYDNLKTMFNIHMKRKEWSTGAVAEALNELFRIRPSLKEASIRSIAFETGLGVTEIREAKHFLMMPEDDRQRALHGELDEYYLILLSRNMRSIQNALPKIITKGNWNPIAKTFIKKVDDGWIDDARSFNYLGRAVRACIESDRPDLFERAFSELLREPSQTPEITFRHVQAELLSTTEKELVKEAKLFLGALKHLLEQNGYRVGADAHAILLELRNEIEKSHS